MLYCYCQGGDELSILKQYRKDNNLTMQQMADKLKVSYFSYAHYERGSRRIPYDVLARFLEIRGFKNDYELAKILKGINE